MMDVYRIRGGSAYGGISAEGKFVADKRELEKQIVKRVGLFAFQGGKIQYAFFRDEPSRRRLNILDFANGAGTQDEAFIRNRNYGKRVV